MSFYATSPVFCIDAYHKCAFVQLLRYCANVLGRGLNVALLHVLRLFYDNYAKIYAYRLR